MADVFLWVLGSPRIERGGEVVSMDTRKAVALLTYLALERRPHSRDILAALLWPEYDQPHARAALRRTLSTLLKALGDEVVRVEREALALGEAAPLWVDAAEFQARIAVFKAHQHPTNELCPACRGHLAAAVALYQGDFLAGFHLRDSSPFEDWQFTQSQALRRDLGTALASLTRDAIGAGQFETALGYAQRWLALDRLNEQAHRFLMRLYAWTGQPSIALQQYRECLQILDRELGVAPLDVTTRLYEAIKQHRLASPRAHVPATVPASTKDHHERGDHTAHGNQGNHSGAQTERVPAATATLPSTPPDEHATGTAIGATGGDTLADTLGDISLPRGVQPPLPPGDAVPLLGRAPELRAIEDAYAASAREGQLVVVEGEAGIGKTRLAEELLAQARNEGATTILVRCYEGEAALAYAPIAAALRAATLRSEHAPARTLPPDLYLSEAARLVPELRESYPQLASPPALESVGAQVRFFEGVRQVILRACAGPRPGILCVDDAQWADAATLELLAYLVRRLRDDPVCLLLTWRSAEVAPPSRLRHILADAQRAGHATHIGLNRLDPSAIDTWVHLAMGERASATVARRIYAETEGLPFFVGEYVRALAGGALNVADPQWHTPGGVHDLLRSRLRAVDEASLQVLTAAAILGRSFDFDTVREVSGRSAEETLVAVEELCAQGLVTEFSDSVTLVPQYDFAHDKLRALVLDQTSLARRRLLHGRAAAALAHSARSSHDATTIVGQIAQHALAAGDTQAAAEHFKHAGDRARGLYAHADALRHYEQARALGYSDSPALHEALGDVLLMLGNYGAAITNYELAAAAAAPADLWRLELQLGRVYARRGEWSVAESYLESALARLDALSDAAPGERSAVCAEWSLVARSSGRLAEAESLAERALALAEEAHDDQALAQAHNLLGLLARGAGDTAGALAHLEQSLALAERLGDPGARAAALNNLALALGESGQRADAITAAEAALTLAVAQGDRHHEAALHNNLADLLHAAGHAEVAMDHLKQAVAIFAEIGHEAGTLQPGIWMLTDW